MAASRSGIWGWIRALFCLLLFFPVLGVGSQEAAKQWLVDQIHADGSLDSPASKAITFQSTTEAAINLLDADQSLAGVLSGVTSYLASVDADHSAENLSRSIRTAYALGQEFGEAQDELLKRQIAGSGFGAFPGYDPDPLSTAYALETLSLLGITQEPAAYALQYLINAQNDDGSWALAGDVGRVQTTALAMHALWQYRHIYDVESPLQAAADFLLAQQEGQLWGDTESSALALYALVSRAVDRTTLQQALDALQNRQNPGGDFEQDVYVTALALRVLSAASRPAADITSLTGTLVDAQSGQPLSGVEIALDGPEPRQLVTDADGDFFADRLIPGHYQLSMNKGGYSTLVLNTVLQTGEKRDLGTLALSIQKTDPDTGEPLQTGIVRGTITDRDSGAPLAQATVTLTGTGLSSGTATDGSYLFSEVPAGPLSITASAQGYESVTGNAEMAAGQTLLFSPGLKVSVPEGVSVFGTISSSHQGASISGAMVSAEVQGVAKSVTTDAQGQYRLEDLPAGNLTLGVSAAGFESVSAEAEVSDGASVEFSPLLAPTGDAPQQQPGGFQGVVIDAITGRGVVEAQVSVDYLDGTAPVTVTTDSDGYFQLRELLAAEVEITITASGYSATGATARVEAGVINDLGELELVPLDSAVNSISGKVVDVRTQNPLQGVLVKVKVSSSTVAGEAMTDSSGRFEVKGLSLGEYTLEFSQVDYQPLSFPVVIATGGDLDLGEVRLRQPGIDALLPDLAVQSTQSGDLLSDPDTFEVSGELDVVIINRGNADLTQPFAVRAFSDADRDGAFSPDHDPVLGETDVEAMLEVDGTQRISIPVQGDLPFRDAPLHILLDAGEAISELSETNNIESTAGECASNQKPYLDLALCLDSSGSVSYSEFQLQLEGTAQAIENPDIVPRDGSMRLSLLQFSSRDYLEIDPTVIEEDNVAGLADAIRGVRKRGGGTSIHSCIDGATEVVGNATPTTALQVIDVSTDGQSSQSAAVAASERARAAGIDVINSIGVGGGANETLLSSIVFPKPAGGERGFVLMVDSYEEYIEGISSKVAKETKIPDLTLGALQFVDNGVGELASVAMVIGNAGSADISEDIHITLFDGHPDTGTEIGDLIVGGGVKSGAHKNAVMDDVGPDQLQGVTLYARASIEGQVAECNNTNNLTQKKVAARRGSLTLTLSDSLLAPTEDLNLDSLVINTGGVEADYSVQYSIFDSSGALVANLGNQPVPALPSGEQRLVSAVWNSGVTLAGDYQAIAELYSQSGERLDSQVVPFSIREGGDVSAPVATVGVGTDKPDYYQGDKAVIENTLLNSSSSTLIQPANYRLIVSDESGNVLLNKEYALSGLAIGQVMQLYENLSLEGVSAGNYEVVGTLVDDDGDVLASDRQAFTISISAIRAVDGEVQVRSANVYQGDPQTCDFTLRNISSEAIQNLTVINTRLDVDNQGELHRDTRTVSLQPGGTITFSDVFGTAGFNLTRHACALQVEENGEQRDIDNAVFQIEEPPISLQTTLSVSGKSRLLVLADKPQDTCTAVDWLTLRAEFPKPLSASTLVSVKALNSLFFTLDLEASTPQAFTDLLDSNIRADMNVAVTSLTREAVEVRVSGSALLSGKHNIVAKYPIFLFLQGKLETGLTGFKCGYFPALGQKLGDFEVVDINVAETQSASHAQGHPETPSLVEQQQWLDAFLTENGYSYTLVDSLDSFRDALLSGNYQQYLLLADRVPLGHWTAKQLREAVNRGDGLVYAAGDRPRTLPLYQTLGVHPHESLLGNYLVSLLGWDGHRADGVEFMQSPLSEPTYLPLALDRRLPRIHHHQANVAALYQGVSDHSLQCLAYSSEHDAVTYRDYGEGRAVYVGYDLLAEAVAEGGSEHHAGLLSRALEYTTAENLINRPGTVFPVTLSLQNTGPAVDVQADLAMSSGGDVLNTLPATQNGPLSWQLALGEAEQRNLHAWLVPNFSQGSAALSAEVTASLGSGASLTLSEMLPLQEGPDTQTLMEVTQAVQAAYGQSLLDLKLKKAALLLEMAVVANNHGHEALAIKKALKATSALAGSSHPDAPSLRVDLDWAIWALNR